MRSIRLLTAAAFASVASIRIADPLLPQIASEFQVSVGRAAVIASALSIAYGVSQLVAGLLGEAFDKYRIVAISTLLCGVCACAAALCPTLDLLTVARLAAGVAAAGIIPTAMAYIGDMVPYEERQVALARLMAGSMLGLIAGQLAGGFAADLVGWRGAFWVLAAAQILVGAALWREAPKATKGSGRSASGPSLRHYWSLLRTTHSRTVLVAVGLEGMLFYGEFVYFGAFLRYTHQLDYWLIGFNLAAFGVGGLAYSAMVRPLIAALGERGLARLGGVSILLGFATVAWGPVWLAAIAIAAGGWGYMALHTTLQVKATQMAPHARGQGMGLFSFSLFCGQSVGISAVGYLMTLVQQPILITLAGTAVLVLALWFARTVTDRA